MYHQQHNHTQYVVERLNTQVAETKDYRKDTLRIMADDEPATLEQIAEYESQLAGIVDLLKESPGDESLLALKKDMEELLELSRANLATDTTDAAASSAVEDGEQMKMPASTDDLELPPPPLPPPPPPPLPETTAGIPDSTATGYAAVGLPKEAPTEATITETASKKEKPHKVKKSKKQKKVKDFVLPDHLVPNEADTDAERKKKRRAAKALKNKWRIQKNEIEANNRQNSWQSFQKKSSSSSSTSIFATKEGLNDRVGVVAKKQLTEFGARKRHK